jgi:glutamine amidotransferase PdxT
MTSPVKKLTPASEDLVRLRDEIAMQALNGLVINGGWSRTMSDGSKKRYVNMRDYSEAAYEFADQMLAARERKQ